MVKRVATAVVRRLRRPPTSLVVALCALGWALVAADRAALAPSVTRAAPSEGDISSLRMAMVRDRQVLVRQGDQERVLYEAPENGVALFPAWSPDGGRIAFVQEVFAGQGVDFGDDIYVLDAAGGDPRLVWQHDERGAQIMGIAWGADGASLLFGYQRVVVTNGRYAGQIQRIDRVAIDGGDRSTVVENGLFPSLSARGDRLAFEAGGAGGPDGVWLANGDGSDAHQISGFDEGFALVYAPRISPDGATVVVSALSYGDAGARLSFGRRAAGPAGTVVSAAGFAHGFPLDLWRIPAAGGMPRRLTRFGEDDPVAAWTADSAMLVVLATGGLYTLALDSGALTRVGPGWFGGQLDLR